MWFLIANACCLFTCPSSPAVRQPHYTGHDMTWLILSPWTSWSTPWRDRCVIQLRFHINCATNCVEHNSFSWVSRLCSHL